MSLLSQFFSYPQRVLTTSFSGNGTYSPLIDAWHWFAVIGAGGGGAGVDGILNDGRTALALGGNGGSVKSGWVFLKSSQTYTINVGTGGVRVRGSSSAVTGSTGGQTTLSGGDLAASIVAKGGTGGVALLTAVGYDQSGTLVYQNASNAASTGQGTEYTGGKGGKGTFATYVTSTLSGPYFATGGGAANVTGAQIDNIRGGDLSITGSLPANNPTWAATGGGGTGGHGWDDITSGGTTSVGAGGGSGGSAIELLGGVGSGSGGVLEPNGKGGVAIKDPAYDADRQADLSALHGGSGAGGGAMGPDGLGIFNMSFYGGAGIPSGGAGGMFGGGAGMTHADTYNYNPGQGGVFGGGGGGAASAKSSAGFYSGAGGDGGVILQAYTYPSN